MKLEDIGIVLLPNNRSKAYLQNLLANNIIPGNAIYLDSGSTTTEGSYSGEYPFNPNETVLETLQKMKITPTIVGATDCNESLVIAAVSDSPSSYQIYCGGGILQDEILSVGKTFIHVHPGTVPQYRGSTCFYYEMLNEGRFGATAFFMAPGIDTGEVLEQKTYPPTPIDDIDGIFDPWMRSDVLVLCLQNYIKNGGFKPQKQSERTSETYYIIHPVVKTLAIEHCKNLQKM